MAGRKPLGSKWLVGSSHGASGCDYRRGLGMGYGRGAWRPRPTTKPTEQEIKALLDKLVSPNPKPITDEDRDKHMAPDRQSPALDEKKQGEVRRARIELRKLGSDTFQFLIDRWKDDRYSLTVENMLSGYSRNQSVGRVCQTILYDQIQPYGYWQSSGGPDPRSKPMRPCYPEKFLSSQEAARQWWKKHKAKPLDQIQLEVLDWVIAEEGKSPKKFSNKEKSNLQQIRRKLLTGGKPLPPGNYYANEIE